MYSKMAFFINFKVLLLLSFTNLILVSCDTETIDSNSPSKLLRIIQSDLGVLQERIKIDLNEKFSKLSSQLDENNRKVVKTLSLFENEWNEKSERLNVIEERQTKVENVVMKLTKMVHELKQGQSELQQMIRQRIEDGDENFGEITKKLKRNATAYVLSGTESNYQRIKRIPPEEQQDLVTIELQYVEIVPHILLESLKNCTNLKVLKMVHVKLLGNFDDRILLPQLTHFVLHQDDIFQFSNETIFLKWSELDDYLQGFDKIAFKSLVFFDKNSSSKWDVEDIPKLGTNIDLEVDGVKLFQFSPGEHYINSMLKFGNEIVTNLDEPDDREDFELKKLSLSSWRLDIDALPSTITHLNFNYVLHPNETDFKRKLQRFKSLEELNMFVGNRGQQSLAPFPTTLRNLTIRFSDLTYAPTYYIRRLNLDYLYFHFCRMSLEVIENFHYIFNSRNVGVTFRRHDNSSMPHKLLENILKTGANWIFMHNFQREAPVAIELEDITQLVIHSDIEQFLKSTGISKQGQDFVLEKKNGVWKGKEIRGEELLFLVYHLAGTNKFVTFNTYKRLLE